MILAFDKSTSLEGRRKNPEMIREGGLPKNERKISKPS